MEGSVNAANNQCTVITAPQFAYNGAHVGTYYGPGGQLTPDAVKRYEAASGEKVDYVLDFMAFSTGLNFPTVMADYMAERNGTLLIRLEPWTPKPINGRDNLVETQYDLESIAAGRWDDKLLKKFAKGAIEFSKKHHGKVPIWVSFAHEMNMELVNKNRYPWAGRPKEYKEAYRHVVDVIRQEFVKAGAVQVVNWVWNPNIDFPGMQDYYPETEADVKAGRTYVHWAALDGYNSEDTINANWKPFPMLFSTGLAQIATFGKPIMIAEYGCDTVDRNDPKLRDKYIADETRRKPDFMIGTHFYIIQDGRIKAASSFNEVKMEAGSEKRYGLTSPEQEKISRLIFAPDSIMNKAYAETIQAKTVSCQTVNAALQTKEDITPKKMISDRKLVLDQALRYVILPAAEGALGYQRTVTKDKVAAWLDQKEEMIVLADGLLNAWYIYRELGKPANPAGQECQYLKEVPGTKKTKEVACLPELKNDIAEINRDEKNKRKSDYNFLPTKTTPVVPYLNEAINFAIGVVTIKYPAETTSQDNIERHEKLTKKRALVYLASIASTLAGEVSEKDSRLVLASLMETYLPALLKNNAINDRTLRAAISALLLGLEENKLATKDRDWLAGLEEKASFGEKDTEHLLQLVQAHFYRPVVLPLVEQLRGDQPLKKTDQFRLLAVVDQIFNEQVRQSERALHDGNVFALIDEIRQNPGLTTAHRARLGQLEADIRARQDLPDSEKNGKKYTTTAQEAELYKLMDAYLPHAGRRTERTIADPVLTNQFDRSLYKKKSQLLTGKNLALRAFIAKDFLKDKLPPAKIKDLFDQAQKILEQVDTFQDQADKAETQQWSAKILMVKAGLEKDKDKEFATLGEAIRLIKGIKVDLRHLQLHTQEVERMQAEALARQGFIRKEQKLPYETYFAESKKILDSVLRWGVEYKQLVGANEPLWSQQVVALAKLWYGKVRLVELGEEKQGTRLATVESQKKELEKVQTLLGTAINGLQSEPALQADVYRSLGEIEVRLAYTRKDLGAEEAEIKGLIGSAQKHLTAAAKNGIDLTKVEAEIWLAKSYSLAADYEKSRDEELAKLAAAAQAVEKALQLAPGIPELKGRSLSDLYATRGEILLKQGNFQAAVSWLDKAVGAYDKNYDAKLNLADVLTWQKEYGKAALLYDQVLADEAGFDPNKSRFSDELAFDRARISRYELAMRRDRSYGGAESYLTKLIAKEAPASSLRKRAIAALLELYSNRNEWHERIAAFYEKELKGKPILNDLAFSRETLRKVAEAYGWLKQFEAGRAVLKQLPEGYWREATRLSDAELEMHDKKMKLGIRSGSDADPQLGAAVIAAAKTILATRTDDPMLVLKAINALAEAAGSEKLFMGMIALGSLLLGENYTPKSEAEKEALAVLTAGLRQLPGGKLPLDGNYLAAVFQNFSPKALAAARLQAGRLYADGLMWQKNYPAAIARLEKLAQAGADPTLTEREKRLVPADANMKLGEIYRYELKEEEFPASKATYFTKSLEYYDRALAKLNGKVAWVGKLAEELAQADLADPEATAAVLARYADQAARLEDDELSALANLYIGRGETRRYAQGKTEVTKANATPEDIRNYDEARRNYLLAQLFIGTMPGELIDEKHLLSAKLHNGYGKVGEVLGVKRVGVAEHFQQAHEAFQRYLSAGNLPPEGGLGGEIERGLSRYGSFRITSSNSGGTGYTDRYGRAEQRFEARLELPLENVIPGLPKELVTLTLADSLDHGNNALNNSLLAGARVYLFDNEKMGSAAVSAEGRIYGSQRGTFSLLPHPQARAGLSLWNNYFTSDTSVSIDNSDHARLNSYYANLYWNGASVFKNDPYLRGFRAGGVYNHLPYYVDGEGYRVKDTFSLGLDYQLDLAEVSRAIPYSTVLLNPFVRVPLYQYAPINRNFEDLPRGYNVNQPFPTGTFEAGLNVQLNTGKFGIFNFGATYMDNRDFTSRSYDYSQWQLRAGWLFVFPDLLGGSEKK